MPGDRRSRDGGLVSALVAALGLSVILAAAPARAGASDDPGGAVPAQGAPAAAADTVDPDGSPRATLARQLADQAASVDRAIAAVGDKLTGVEAARARRLAAALRAVRADPADDAAAVARRRAAAHLLLQRDLDERALLIDELARLRTARDRVAGDLARLPAVALPGELARPAPGRIARHFGTLEHERSRATLSRRGIDLEVDDHSPVTAPAAGTVRYAGPIRGLDQGVIIDCGDFVAVVGKLGEIAAPVGALIAAGDRLGRAARHRVYLELRVKLGPGGLPIDPEPLLAGAAPRAPVPRVQNALHPNALRPGAHSPDRPALDAHLTLHRTSAPSTGAQHALD